MPTLSLKPLTNKAFLGRRYRKLEKFGAYDLRQTCTGEPGQPDCSIGLTQGMSESLANQCDASGFDATGCYWSIDAASGIGLICAQAISPAARQLSPLDS